MLSIYKASAGSGKTFTLTREYIKYLLGIKNPETNIYALNKHGRNRHRGILAITFTNKATDEMRHRIIHELAVLGNAEPGWSKPSPYASYLTQTLHCTEEELREEAHRALHELLLDYHAFQISTIDSFFQRVLRSFAREAELSGNYDIEMDSKQVLHLATAQLFQSLNSPDPEDRAKNLAIEEWLGEYMMHLVHNGNSFNIFNRSNSTFANLVSFLEIIFDEEFQKNSDLILDYLSDRSRLGRFRAHITKQIDDLNSERKIIATRILKIIDDSGLPIEKILGSNPRNSIINSASQETKKIATTETKFYTDTPDAFIKAFREKGDPGIRQALTEQIYALGEVFVALKRFTSLNSIFTEASYRLGLVYSVADEMKKNLTRDNMLMISDTATVLKKIIADDATPFVYERLGTRLHNFLIDEFQDTSELQWHNLSPLVNEGLSTNLHDSLIIGDEKQCIYRFRNSNPDLLKSKVGEEFAVQLAPPDPTCTNTNWRSSANVVKFNNELFTKIAADRNITDIYSNVTQQIAPINQGDCGYVCVNLFPFGDGKLTVEQYSEIALKQMMEDIVRQINSGYKPSQIAVLVRQRKQGIRAIEYILNARRINPEWPELRVVSDDSLELNSSPAVRMVISALKVMASETESVTGRTTSRRHFARIIEKIEELSTANGMPRSEALVRVADAEIQGEFADNILSGDSTAQSTPEMACVNLVSIVELIIRTRISEEMRDSQNMFLSSLLDVVNDFQQRNENNLRAFIKWWDSTGKKHKVALPPDDGAIRVMTIHKSKGLEFACVHIPFANWPLYDPKSPEWFNIDPTIFPGCDPADVPRFFPIKPDKGMLDDDYLAKQYREVERAGIVDEINTMYVAFTRAIDELIVSANIAPVKKGKDSVADLLKAALPIQQGAYTVGTPTTAPAEKKKAKTAIEPTSTVAMPQHKTFENKSFWENTCLDNSDEPIADSRSRGLEFHEILSKLVTLKDFAKMERTLIKSGVTDAESAALLIDNLRQSIDRLGIGRWFDNTSRILCETEIALADGTLRRFDRAVWLPDDTIEIIDYKTGQKRNSLYKAQVKEYIEAFLKMGYKNVKGYLWYLDLDIVEEVK